MDVKGEMRSEIYIFGAGNYGVYLSEFLSKLGVSLSGFIVSKMQEEYVNGYRVFEIDQVAFLNDVTVLLAVSDNHDRQIITNRLISKGARPYQIIDFSSFIAANAVKHGKFCNICGKYSKTFLPFGVDSEIARTKRVVGTGVRAQCICPKCGSLDRDRWLLYLISNKTTMLDEKCNILHFAPEKNLREYFKSKRTPAKYYDCDLFKENASIQVDMTDIPFEDDSFDYIIAGHVIQQIKNEKKAISELKRVLKPSGTIILSFPICMDQDTSESSDVISMEDKEKNYGEIYAVRLYGKDYIRRFERYGLRITEFTPGNEFEEKILKEMSLIAGEVVLFCQKS